MGALLVSQGQDLPEHHLKHHTCAEVEGLGWEGTAEGSVSCSPLAAGSFLNRSMSILGSGGVQPGGDSRERAASARDNETGDPAPCGGSIPQQNCDRARLSAVARGILELKLEN